VNVAADSRQPAFEVVEVVPGGPAQKAGIRAGDRIIGIDGRGPREIGLPGFRAMLKRQPQGTRVKLRISAPGGDKNAVIVLRDLV
jgi:carboxyl-terminal processing protease